MPFHVHQCAPYSLKSDNNTEFLIFLAFTFSFSRKHIDKHFSIRSQQIFKQQSGLRTKHYSLTIIFINHHGSQKKSEAFFLTNIDFSRNNGHNAGSISVSCKCSPGILLKYRICTMTSCQ